MVTARPKMLSALQRSRLPLIHDGVTTPPFLSSRAECLKFQAKAADRTAVTRPTPVRRRGHSGAAVCEKAG